MNTYIELVITAGRFLVGLWPLMFLAVLAGIFKKRKGFKESLRTSIKALVIAWAFFAVLNLVFFIFKQDTFHLLPESINSKAFFCVGLLLLPLEIAVLIEERHRIIDAETIQEMQQLTASEFERLVAQTYRAQGHEVEEVGSVGDHGIDLIVHTRKGETWLIQCKKYRGKVGEPVIRDFYGTLKASNANAGAVITTGQITAQARLWAEGKPLYLYDGDEFLRIIETTRIRRALPVDLLKKPEKPASDQENDFEPIPEEPATRVAAEPVISTPAPGASATPAPAKTEPAKTTTSPAAMFLHRVSSAVANHPAIPVSHASVEPARVAVPVARAAVVTETVAAVEPDLYPPPDKRPFMDINPEPDCPACGLPMIATTQKRFPLKNKVVYICQNAPSCSETIEA